MAKKKLNNSGGIVYSTANDFRLNDDENEVENLPPGQQLLKIKLDKKHRGGKMVTIVNGFAMDEEEIENLSKQLKTFCGTGGSAKNYEIIIQGDQRDKVFQWLIKNGFVNTKMQG